MCSLELSKEICFGVNQAFKKMYVVEEVLISFTEVVEQSILPIFLSKGPAIKILLK